MIDDASAPLADECALFPNDGGLFRADGRYCASRGRGCLRKFGEDDLLKAVGHRQDEIRDVAGFHAREPKWKSDALEFQLEFTLAQNSLREVERKELP